MSDEDGGTTGRDVGQALLAVAVVVGLLAAAGLLPSASGDPGSSPGSGLDGTPPEFDFGGSGADPPVRPGIGEGRSGLGALNPPDSTGVGGSLAGEGGNPLRNTSDVVHFTVESDSPAYWRTGAYGRYTGSGWKQRGGVEPYTGPLDGEGERIRQSVTVERPATALPAAWRPTGVSVTDGDPRVYVASDGSFVVPGGIDAGTTYEVTSHRESPSPGDLRGAGERYPDSVDRFRRVPPDTPDRLGEFTADLTSDADGAYETARIVELWLERSKTYSLDASHDPSKPVASQFVFEMDQGYCEYFATAMAAMLRTQDIPARYVVGYAPGTQVGEDRYEVRAMDAHAWVEVYFPGEGWVRFDPTPAAPRRGTERESIGEDGGPDRRPPIAGSPGDGGEDGVGPGDAPGLPDDGGAEPRAGPPYRVSLNASPVPGRPVTATVTKDGLPVEGAVVTFNGDPVGRTDRNGNVTARVPYAEDLQVNARPPGDEGEGSGDGGTRADLADGDRTGDEPAPGARLGRDRTDRTDRTHRTDPDGIVDRSLAASLAALTAAPSVAGVGRSVAGETGSVDSRGADPNATAPYRVDVPTDVNWTTEGPFAPGRTAVLVATIDGVPVRNAAVSLAGRSVGRTDRAGRVTVAVPEDRRGSVTVAIRKGGIEDEDDLALSHLDVSVRPDSLVALPGVGATVSATVDGVPVPNATVTMGGREVGTTGPGGTVRTTLPFAAAVDVRADGPVMAATTTVGGIYRNAAVLAVLVVGLVVGAVHRARRRDLGPRDVGRSAGSALARAVAVGARLARRAGALAVRTLAGLRRLGSHAFALAGALAGRLGDRLARVLGRVRGAGIRRIPALVAGWVAGGLRRVAGALLAVPGLVFGLPARLWWVLAGGSDGTGGRETVPGTGARDESDGTGGRETVPGTGARDESDGDGPLSPEAAVRAAFRELVSLLRVRGWRTMTPGEIARTATDAGLPAGPVGTITDAFRDLEYGGGDASESVRDRVTRALSELRDSGGDR